MRNHYALGAAIEDASGVVRVAGADTGDGRNAEAERGDADRSRRLQRSRVVLEVDVAPSNPQAAAIMATFGVRIWLTPMNNTSSPDLSFRFVWFSPTSFGMAGTLLSVSGQSESAF
jgi:hypothetical protein